MRFGAIAIAFGILSLAPAYAQTETSEIPPQQMQRPAPADWNVTIGAATVLSPVWQGSSDIALSLFPDLRFNYRNEIFASVPEGLGWNAIKGDGLRAGPLVKPRFGRDENNGGSPFLIAGSSDALIGLGDIGIAGEAGGFVEQQFGRTKQWRLRAEVRQGFGAHTGVVADASIDYRVSLGRNIAFIGPRISAGSSQFMQTYFGINALQSQQSGLAVYDADGGILSYGLGGTAIRPLNRRSAITLFTSLDRLAGPAADSPLVRERGQRTQFTVGLGYGLRFGL